MQFIASISKFSVILFALLFSTKYFKSFMPEVRPYNDSIKLTNKQLHHSKRVNQNAIYFINPAIATKERSSLYS